VYRQVRGKGRGRFVGRHESSTRKRIRGEAPHERKRESHFRGRGEILKRKKRKEGGIVERLFFGICDGRPTVLLPWEKKEKASPSGSAGERTKGINT